MNIIAHRGLYTKTIPENSKLAFMDAVKENIPIEFDIQITKDNKLIIFHDANTYRLTNKNYEIKDTDYDVLKKLKLKNSNQNIMTFSELLKLVNGKVFLDIEIKSTKKVNTICNLVLNELKNYKGNYSIKSFNVLIIKKIKKLDHNVKIGLLINSKYLNTVFRLIYCKPNFISINKKLLNNSNYIRLCKKYKTQVWTINNKKEYEKYKKYCCVCNNVNEII